MSEQIPEEQPGASAVPGVRFLLTWVATGMLIYGLLSGLLIWLLPFSVLNQYSVLIHSGVGVVVTLPVTWLVYSHWQRRNTSITGSISDVPQVMTVVTPGPCPALKQLLCTTTPIVTAPCR